MSVALNTAAGLQTLGGYQDSTNRYLEADMERIRLAGQVRPNMSQAETEALHQKDKALALQSTMDKVNSEYQYAWHLANEERRKKDVARRQEAIANGFLYA